MKRYWWLQVSCLMNSDIDPATMPVDNDPPVSQPSFRSSTMGSSCEIRHAASAKHPSIGTGKCSRHIQTGRCVAPYKRYYITLTLNAIYEWLCNDFKGVTVADMHLHTSISNQMRRAKSNYVLIRAKYWFNHLKPHSHNSTLKTNGQVNSIF